MSLIRYLPPETVRIEPTADGAPALLLEGDPIPLGEPRRVLPLADPGHYIALYDPAGNELGVIREMAGLEPQSQAELQRLLERAYRMEEIVRVLEVDKEPLSGSTRWRVELAGPPPEGHTEPAPPPPRPLLSPRAPAVAGAALNAREAGPVHEREFSTSGQEDVQTARYPHIYIVDTDRNRYHIPNCDLLDRDSRRVAERFF